ncbi:TRAP transporter large permease [Haematobacter missouriensis]|uniref:TRAP transporter large permease protein n=1 Tax=Haematobacter missouriensis TaxID=366616 RepID=A0A225D6J7_9RHOB|nr:TRAP transporter large permease [Haematobacter missouriensis]OWJ77101.1 C4-dicarboxylate ABC transporter permease [Haematobacter missouriensis]OWJ83729.1 C4-dicarboxylate ABC transporter permease [Haematobacter missouriensis]
MTAGLSFLLLLAIGAPISFVLIGVALILIVAGGNAVLLDSFPQQLFAGIESYGLLALPLFILLGELMGAGGIGRRLLALAEAMMVPVRAGLAYVNLLANLMMAAVLGSTVAQLTVMSRLAVPEMERAGYPRDLATTVTAAGGLLAPVIPPSMNLIVYATVAQVPVADVFVAGIVPGLAMAAVFALIIAWLGWKHNLPRVPSQPARRRLLAAWHALPALVVPLVVVGSILTGVATPTESAAIASLAAVLIGMFVYRELRFADLPQVFVRTAATSGAVLFLVAAAQIIGWVVTFAGLPAQAAEWIQDVASSPLAFLILLNILLLLLGTVLEPIPAIILVAPVLLPVATDVYGIDSVTFGVILCLNLTLGLLTPPVGAGLYTASLLTGVSAERLSRLLVPFFAGVIAILAGMTVIAALNAG